MSAELGIEVVPAEADGRITIIRLKGSLDSGTYIELDERMQEVTGNGKTHLVFDLAELDYIASAGIGVFINNQNVVQESGGAIALAGPTNAVRQVFGILGLQALFQIHENVEAGVAALQEAMG